MPKYGDDLLLLCRGLQANGAQIFWDTLYANGKNLKCDLSYHFLISNILFSQEASSHIFHLSHPDISIMEERRSACNKTFKSQSIRLCFNNFRENSIKIVIQKGAIKDSDCKELVCKSKYS